MMLFDCSIHGDSNFSICAGILADHDIEIRPVSTKLVNEKQIIKDVVMRLHIQKEAAPEYRIISGRWDREIQACIGLLRLNKRQQDF